MFEAEDDIERTEEALTRVRARVAARNGVASSRGMSDFERYGWHATNDLPEFAEPLIEEIDTDGAFKGHVRFAVMDAPATDAAGVYDHLFAQLLAHLLMRYRGSTEVEVIFERDKGRTLESYTRLVEEKWENATVIAIPKGDNLLALADYLLYAAMNYAARAEQICDEQSCEDSHLPPTASALRYDHLGSPLAVGHLGKDDRWHKRYYAFVRVMSSVVRLQIAGSEAT